MQAIGKGAVSICWISRCGRGRSGIAGSCCSLAGSSALGVRLVGSWLGEELVEAAREVALEAAERAFLGFPVGLFAGEVLAGRGVVLGAGDRDDVQRVVELAVPTAVESVLVAFAR